MKTKKTIRIPIDYSTMSTESAELYPLKLQREIENLIKERYPESVKSVEDINDGYIRNCILFQFQDIADKLVLRYSGVDFLYILNLNYSYLSSMCAISRVRYAEYYENDKEIISLCMKFQNAVDKYYDLISVQTNIEVD